MARNTGAAKIFMLIGCPGVGKTWITSQVGDLYDLVLYDAKPKRTNADYVREVDEAAKSATRPLIIETPFSISEILDPLRGLGHDVTPMFVIEDPMTVAERYLQRTNRPIPKGHLTRQETYRRRAREMNAFQGTAQEVAETLKSGQRMLAMWGSS